jgi:hypothetical protein
MTTTLQRETWSGIGGEAGSGERVARGGRSLAVRTGRRSCQWERVPLVIAMREIENIGAL